jgi:hypothetical protein
MRPRASKLIQLALQLNDWLWDRRLHFAVQYQPTSAAD